VAVHFVYRHPIESPAGKYVVHFPDDTVLTWFQRHWSHLVTADEDVVDRLDQLGCLAWDLYTLFEAAARHNLGPPASDDQLREYLERYLKVKGMVHCRPHAIQVLTDNDEVMLSYFFFDDHFLEKYGERVSFLLLEHWQLPGGAGPGGFRPDVTTLPVRPAGQGEGTTYLVTSTVYARAYLDDLGDSHRIEGIRLPELARYLALSSPRKAWPFELALIRCQLLTPPPGADERERPFLEELQAQRPDETPWMVYSDWLVDHGQPPAGTTLLRRALEQVPRLPLQWLHQDDQCRWALTYNRSIEGTRKSIAARLPPLSQDYPLQSHVHAEEHLAQVCIYVPEGTEPEEPECDGFRWHQWYFFDDLWASAHPALANALLAFGRRWDLLSSWKSRPLLSQER
jgi:uncharacterized protein (TIGR02996 family)